MNEEMLRAMARNYAYGRLDEMSEGDYLNTTIIANDFVVRYMSQYGEDRDRKIPTSIFDTWVQYAKELEALVVVDLGVGADDYESLSHWVKKQQLGELAGKHE